MYGRRAELHKNSSNCLAARNAFTVDSLGALLDRDAQVSVTTIKVILSPGTQIKWALTLFVKYRSDAEQGYKFIVVKQ